MLQQTIASKKQNAIYLIERKLHDVAFQLNHRCFNNDPAYYSKNAAWAKADALALIEEYAHLRIAKKTLNASIDTIVGIARWESLTDPRTPATEPDPTPEPPADKYANLPAISGGSHDHTAVIDAPKKPAHKPQANRATSQKRDNERAERDRIREQYRIAAGDDAAKVASILTDLGFTVADTRECDDTPVTIWHDADGLATVKQTPYTVKFYNGRPARLRKTADAEFVFRVEHGWQKRGEFTGYVAGVAEAFAAWIAYDDTLGGYGYIDTGEQSPAVDTPPAPEPVDWCSVCDQWLWTTEEANAGIHDACKPEPPANAYTIATDTGHVIAQVSHIDATETGDMMALAREHAATIKEQTGKTITFKNAPQKEGCYWIMLDDQPLDRRARDARQVERALRQTIKEINDPAVLAAVGDLLTVTASGERKPVTVSHDGPWQYPTISGGSHDHTPEPVTYRATLVGAGPGYEGVGTVITQHTARGGEAVAAQYRCAVKRLRRRITARTAELAAIATEYGFERTAPYAPVTNDHTYISVERIRPGTTTGDLRWFPIEASDRDTELSELIGLEVQETNAY